MKPVILSVGSFIEDTNGKFGYSNWSIDGRNAEQPLTIDEIREIAIKNGTYSRVPYLDVPPLEDFGIVYRNDTGEITGFQGFATL